MPDEIHLSVEKIEVPEDFKKILDKANSMIGRLKRMDRKEIYEEIRVLNVHVSENPSLQQINVEISKVQAAKDRLSEILVNAHSNFIISKRIFELLTGGWTVFSDKNSAEKRKGEAELKMYQFAEFMSESEAIYKATSHILKNLDSKQETLSRQVTVFALLLKLDPKTDFSNNNTSYNNAKTMVSAYRDSRSDEREPAVREEEDISDNGHVKACNDEDIFKAWDSKE